MKSQNPRSSGDCSRCALYTVVLLLTFFGNEKYEKQVFHKEI